MGIMYQPHNASSLSLCRAVCGGPPVNWRTATDARAPQGWSGDIAGFSKNEWALCRESWDGWLRYGHLSATMKGYGEVTVKYRDCLKDERAKVYLNGQQKGQSGFNGALATTT